MRRDVIITLKDNGHYIMGDYRIVPPQSCGSAWWVFNIEADWENTDDPAPVLFEGGYLHHCIEYVVAAVPHNSTR